MGVGEVAVLIHYRKKKFTDANHRMRSFSIAFWSSCVLVSSITLNNNFSVTFWPKLGFVLLGFLVRLGLSYDVVLGFFKQAMCAC